MEYDGHAEELSDDRQRSLLRPQEPHVWFRDKTQESAGAATNDSDQPGLWRGDDLAQRHRQCWQQCNDSVANHGTGTSKGVDIRGEGGVLPTGAVQNRRKFPDGQEAHYTEAEE
eukprot:4142887-Ditylum_brightwellii.AAC.1